MASVEIPRPSLSSIRREVSVVLCAAEDPAILTFKQVRVAVEKALGLKEGCLHKDYKPTIREAVHYVMDEMESENTAESSSSPPPRHANPQPDGASATPMLKDASRGKKWNKRSCKKLKFEDPDEPCRRDDTVPVPDKAESERGPAVKTESEVKTVKCKDETWLERMPVGRSSEPETDWRIPKGINIKLERGSSGSRGGGGGGSSGSGSDNGGGKNRKSYDGVACVLSGAKRSKRQVVVKKWKGNIRVDIREYYTIDRGGFTPGLKGVSLNPSQWASLKDSAKVVDERIDALTF